MSISITRKIINFVKALANHIKTGMKKSPQSLINKRYSICLGCEHYSFVKNSSDGIKGQCNKCGCNLSDKKIFLNKLAWKDQQCPIKKW